MHWPLSVLPFGRRMVWTAVDLGLSGHLAAVTLRLDASGGRKPKVTSATLLESDGPTAEEIGRLIETHGTQGKHKVVAVLRRGDYSLFTLARPEVPAQEVERALRWTVGSQVDFPIETASISTLSLPRQEGQEPKVYAIVAADAVLSPVTSLFDKARVTLEAIDIRETAQRNMALRVSAPDECLCLLRLTQMGVQLTFTTAGHLLLDRFIAMVFPTGGIDDAAEQERAAERMAQQTQLSISEVQREFPHLKVRRVVLGPHPHVPLLTPALGRLLDLEVLALDLADVFDLGATPQLQTPQMQAVFFVALGAALRGMREAAHA